MYPCRKKLLMGFGHRVYKNYDPRARIVRQLAEEVFTILGMQLLSDLANPPSLSYSTLPHLSVFL